MNSLNKSILVSSLILGLGCLKLHAQALEEVNKDLITNNLFGYWKFPNSAVKSFNATDTITLYKATLKQDVSRGFAFLPDSSFLEIRMRKCNSGKPITHIRKNRIGFWRVIGDKTLTTTSNAVTHLWNVISLTKQKLVTIVK